MLTSYLLNVTREYTGPSLTSPYLALHNARDASMMPTPLSPHNNHV